MQAPRLVASSARRAMLAPQLPPRQHRLEQSEETSRSGAPAHRRRAMAAAAPPPPRWLTVAATFGFAALHLGSQRGGARAQVFDWNGISVKQYEAQLAYESWQKDDTTYSEWAYKNGYLECDDDMQGILASVDNGVYTCDALVLLMECETDLSAGLIPSLPQNTTVADLCPLSCDACIVPGFVFDDIAVVYSTSMCSMCAQGGDSTFAWMKHPHCRDYTSTKTGGPCFPKWEVGCPLQCAQVRAAASPAPRSRLRIALPLCRAHRSHAQSWLCVQWFDRRIVTRTENGGILWAYLTEDGRWCAPLPPRSRSSSATAPARRAVGGAERYFSLCACVPAGTLWTSISARR